MNATEKMLAAVKSAEKELDDAKYGFSSAKSRLELKSSQSIDLFGGSALSRVADIARDTRDLCESLYVACQTQVQILDEICRPLLAENPSVSAIEAVYEMIAQLNEDSTINTNFTASLNGGAQDDIVNISYSPSIESKMIESYWETKYRNHPEQRRKEEEEKASAEKSFRDRMEKYEKDLAKWETIRAEKQKKRDEALTKAFDVRKANAEAELEKKQAKRAQKAEETLAQYRKELSENQEKLTRLKFYQFGEKRECKTNILCLTQQIDAITKKISETEETNAKERRKLERKLQMEKNDMMSELRKKYPIPPKPRRPINISEEGVQAAADEGIKCDILETLRKHGALTRAELIRNCEWLVGLERRVGGWCIALEKEGEIISTKKIVNGTTEYVYDLAY